MKGCEACERSRFATTIDGKPTLFSYACLSRTYHQAEAKESLIVLENSLEWLLTSRLCQGQKVGFVHSYTRYSARQTRVLKASGTA